MKLSLSEAEMNDMVERVNAQGDASEENLFTARIACSVLLVMLSGRPVEKLDLI